MLRLIFAIGLTLCLSSIGHAEIKLSKYPKVYKGEEGVVVTVIPLTPKSKKQALIEVSGIDTEIDGKVFLYNQQIQGRGDEAYVMQYDGDERTRIRVSKGYWSKWMTLYLPDTRDGIKIWYDDKLSKAVKPSQYIRNYERDKNLQAKLAKFNRKKSLDYNKEKFAEILNNFKDDCGKPIKGVIEWKSVNEAILKKYSVYAYCGNPIDSLARFCRKSPENKKAVLAKVSTVNCSFGKKLKARMNGKTLNWVTEPEAGNQSDFTDAFVKNNF
jgi:gamma-glutamylcyclotransferase (GGCT)/AIG2-like uncharacterized protein YtfP